ncbi:hypothetical protein FRB94_009654 [Tulasnella sp. JGI-2019a]|nr:hypothetical protein FRB94_009654 [Tulasnella sp. JGI-2019a]KAG8994960.1 hypothetical protein FRB93_001402 [Tulasnella sp. JGI-2019a]KAG9029626.1 hypothetical protein FRB95_005062 [Tulasnella sp. JGI-2019a]
MNILENAPEGMRGFVVDLGLSVMVRNERNADLLQGFITAVHDHRTGTLPFMAIELLQNPLCEHGIHHDLEAVFWVLLCESLQAMREYQEDLAKSQNGLTEEMMESMPGLQLLEKLRNHDPIIVRNAKAHCLAYPNANIQLNGRHAALESFLIDYADLCFKSSRARPGKDTDLLTFGKVVELMEETIAKLPEDPLLPTSSIATSTFPATTELEAGRTSASGSKRLRPSSGLTEAEVDEDVEESKRMKTNYA